MKTKNTNTLLLCFISTVLFFSACQKDIKPNETSQQANQSASDAEDLSINSVKAGQMVLTWNDAANIAIDRIAPLSSYLTQFPPNTESRICAMVNVAMHDALNTIVPRYERYALHDAIDKDASPAAAVAQAAHDVMVSQLPTEQAYADSLLNVSLNLISDGNAKTKGIALGKASATAMINARANDGSATAQYDIPQGTKPGEYRSTPPFDATGFIFDPGWGKVKPFALASSSQFRPFIPPYPIKSWAYTKDYNELKDAGGSVSKVRTADQTQFAIFWLPITPYMFNQIARTIAAQRNLKDAWKLARLLALVNMAEADDNIASFEAKYYYFFWRPYSAIHLADTDGNPFTKADTTWQPLAPPTPPIPDYPSNHANNGGAGAAVIAEFFGRDDFHFDVVSPQMPGVTRSFTSISQAARENALSRIYVGYHFRHAIDIGELQGYEVGTYVFTHALKPLRW